ncbi:MAG: hypothetical protein QGG96_02080 [Candidatus Poseidoniaceae archaeon]|jgi:hypothetical protein|nr:hypothetical protein [Candidatus Poseidoniaceae archaeon]
MVGQKSGDTSHLYDGKTVRSAAPSRKKLAGTMAGSGSEIPKDAIPTVEVPTFIESLLGGPLVPKMKFLPADKMVQNLQLGCYGVLIALGILTYIVTPAVGTIWFAITGSITAANIMQLLIVIGAVGSGFWGVMGRDARYLLASYVLFILSVLRFASSKVSLSQDIFGFADNDFLLTILVVVYAVLLVMFFELSNGVLRFSMLDTSIRTREVYVMNVKKIVGKYHRSLVINPLIAGTLAMLVLSANTILPAFIGLFSEQTALRMEESVELISVYGVALGTLFVFLVVGGLFALDLPTHLQSWRENKD